MILASIPAALLLLLFLEESVPMLHFGQVIYIRNDGNNPASSIHLLFGTPDYQIAILNPGETQIRMTSFKHRESPFVSYTYNNVVHRADYGLYLDHTFPDEIYFSINKQGIIECREKPKWFLSWFEHLPFTPVEHKASIVSPLN
jgi:hypothetical protein